jgi:hypothetical protein
MAARSLSLREKRLIQAAMVLAIVVLVSLLLRGGGGGAPPPAPVTPARMPASAPAPARALAPPPPPAAIPAATPVPSPDLSQLRLQGLLASGAVIGYANGGQRLVPVGREALPGLVLIRIEQNHAVFRSAGGELRLGFDGAAQPGGPAGRGP